MTGPDLVLLRHARSLPQAGLPAALWTLAPGAMEETAALGRALAAVPLKVAPSSEGRGAGAPPTTSGSGIDLVIASREIKALATARSLAHSLAAEVGTAPGLEEHHRADEPLVEPDEFQRAMRRFFASPETLVFGDETANEAAARFRAAVTSVLASQPGRRLAIVSHGTVMTLLLAAPNGLDPYALWSSLAMPEAFVVRSSDWRIFERLKVEDS